MNSISDITLEQRVLGTLIGYGGIKKANDVLNIGCFSDDRTRKIYQGLVKLTDQEKKITPVTVDYYIKTTGGYVEVGGRKFLLDTIGMADFEYNLEANCKILYEYYIRRSLMELSNTLADGAGVTDPFLLREEVEKKIIGLVSIGGDTTTASNISEELETMFQKIREFGFVGIQTGIKEYDLHTGGMQAQELIVMGSFESNGKTALATNIVYNAAINGTKAKYYSFEQPPSQLVLRQAGMITGYTSKRILMNRLFDTPEVRRAIDSVLALPTLYGEKLNHINSLITDIRYSVKRLGVEFVVVDHLQLLTFDENDIRVGISNCANRLKRLANELKIPIVLLSQVSRPAQGAAKNGPKKNMLKESGAIEQAADIVWMPWIPFNEPSELEEMNWGGIMIPTVKNGYKLMVHTIPKGKNCGVTKWYGYFSDTTKVIPRDEVDVGFLLGKQDDAPF
jgi:replicative DNA helicase